MGKVKSHKLKEIAEQYKQEGILSDGCVIRCDICDCEIAVDEKHLTSRIRQHLQQGKHQRNKALKTSGASGRQCFIAGCFKKAEDIQSRQNQFSADLASTFIHCGIPFHTLKHPSMKKFLEKYTERSVPEESTLRKNYVKPVYDATFQEIISVIDDSPVGFILDETTDIKKRYVLNVLVIPLIGSYVKPMLLKMYELEKTNATTVMQSFTDACTKIWPNAIAYDKVLLLVTDQAPYMKLAGTNLKMMYTNLNHVTCVAHALHRVSEAVREGYTIANDFISLMKKVLTKCPANILVYKESTGNLSLPPHPVITRWGTWIECAIFYTENFEKITNFINNIDEGSSVAAKKLKELMQNPTLQQELFCVHSFKSLCASIKQLEKGKQPASEQWRIFTEAKNSLDGFALHKLEQSLAKNPDILRVVSTDDLPLEHRIALKFAPLVSVDVERSFSMYKNFLTDKRLTFEFLNIERYSVIQYNSFLFYGKTEDGDE